MKIVIHSRRLKYICSSARIFTNTAAYYVMRIPKLGAIALNITIERQ
ncbi:MAG: hypothetical protein KAT65_27755 [Methanophagales archaeon]|nr:hypothetical protein [Methanophagales archaeon]